MLAVASFDITGIELELLFDEELAAKMKRLSENNLNRQLAIIFNNRIVSAPYIRSAFGERAQIVGRFKQEEIRFLMQALSGGLVESLPSDSHTDSAGSHRTTFLRIGRSQEVIGAMASLRACSPLLSVVRGGSSPKR